MSENSSLINNFAKLKCSMSDDIKQINVTNQTNGINDYSGRSYVYDIDTVEIKNIPAFGGCKAADYKTVAKLLASQATEPELKSKFENSVLIAENSDFKPCMIGNFAGCDMSQKDKLPSVRLLVDKWFDSHTKTYYDNFMADIMTLQGKINSLIINVDSYLQFKQFDLPYPVSEELAAIFSGGLASVYNKASNSYDKLVNGMLSNSTSTPMGIEKASQNIIDINNAYKNTYKEVKTQCKNIKKNLNKLFYINMSLDNNFESIKKNIDNFKIEIKNYYKQIEKIATTNEKQDNTIKLNFENTSKELDNILKNIDNSLKICYHNLIVNESFLVCKCKGIITFLDFGHDKKNNFLKIFIKLQECVKEIINSEKLNLKNAAYFKDSPTEFSKTINDGNNINVNVYNPFYLNDYSSKIEATENKINALELFLKICNSEENIEYKSSVAIYITFIPASYNIEQDKNYEGNKLTLSMYPGLGALVTIESLLEKYYFNLLGLKLKKITLEKKKKLNEDQQKELNNITYQIENYYNDKNFDDKDTYLDSVATTDVAGNIMTKAGAKLPSFFYVVGKFSTAITAIQIVENFSYYSSEDWIEEIQITVFDKNENHYLLGNKESYITNKLSSTYSFQFDKETSRIGEMKIVPDYNKILSKDIKIQIDEIITNNNGHDKKDKNIIWIEDKENE